MTKVTNNDDLIDPRDIHDDVQELEAEIADLQEELKPLKDLAENAPSDGPLIRESYFTEYAQELAEELGLINRDNAWPACHIDWDEAADALKVDYSTIEFDGVTYYYRA